MMSADILPCDGSVTTVSKTQSATYAVEGVAQVSFVRDRAITRLGHLYCRAPLKVLFPVAGAGDPPTAVIVTTGGGYLSGDHHTIDIVVGSEAKALITSQAAEKVYKSNGSDCRMDVSLQVGQGGVLEWLPQETIVYDHARFHKVSRVDVMETGMAFVGEWIVLGRMASGESFTGGLLRDVWEVHRENRLVWVEAFHLDDVTLAALHHRAGLDGARAFATALLIAERAEIFLEGARDDLGIPEDVRTSATVVNGVLVLRWLSQSPLALRRAFGTFWSRFRQRVLGRSPVLPRIWHC